MEKRVTTNLQMNCVLIGKGGFVYMVSVRREGYKTKSRKQILDFLKEKKDSSVSVSEIKENMEKIGCAVNLSTIYRYMDKLVEEGSVMKYHSEKGEKAGFQYIEPEHNCHCHLHLQCVKCGKIIHLNYSFMEEIQVYIEKYHGFTIQCDNSILYGICQSCKKE